MVWLWFSCGTVCVCPQFSLSRQRHGILDFSYCPLSTRFACDIGQLARIWIWVPSEVITILVGLCLKKTLGSARLTYEELLTVLTKVEGVLNSRRSHLMIGRRLLSRNPNTAPGGASCSSSVTEIARRAKYLKSLLDHFWNRWQKEYPQWAPSVLPVRSKQQEQGSVSAERIIWFSRKATLLSWKTKSTPEILGNWVVWRNWWKGGTAKHVQ